MVRRAGLLAVAAVVLAGVADAQYVRPARMDETGWLAMGAPAGATTGCVGVFLGSPLNLQCAPSSGIVYTVATKSLDVTDGRVQAGNLRAIPLPASGSVTVTNQGTAGATTYTYSLQACLADGTCNAAGPASTTTTGNATLSVTDFNRLTWSAVPGAASYKIRRDVGGATQGVIWSGTALTVDDAGLAGDGSAKPVRDDTGVVSGSAGLRIQTAGAAATGTLAAADVSGTLVSNYGQAAENTTTLPAAADGYNFIAVVGTAGAGAWHIKAGPTDKLYLDGVALDNADKASLAVPTVGNTLTCVTFQTGATAWDWVCTSGGGATWADGGA